MRVDAVRVDERVIDERVAEEREAAVLAEEGLGAHGRVEPERVPLGERVERREEELQGEERRER